MKVKATYRHVFEVTREVEIDVEAYEAWRVRNGAVQADDESAIERFLNLEDTEFHGEVFEDWRTSEPLPSDFELQWSEVVAATIHTEWSTP